MNGLGEILWAVKQLVQVIRAAYSLGFKEYTREDGERVFLSRSVDGDLIVNGEDKKFTLANLEVVVNNFQLTYETAIRAYEYLKNQADTFRKATEILAPFVLQEELSK
jgi:intergrase/recombinase